MYLSLYGLIVITCHKVYIYILTESTYENKNVCI